MVAACEWRCGLHKTLYSLQQFPHICAPVIASYSFMERMPQLFNFIDPSTADWLEQQDKFGILLQPSLRLFAFIDNVIDHDQRDAFCLPVRFLKCSIS